MKTIKLIMIITLLIVLSSCKNKKDNNQQKGTITEVEQSEIDTTNKELENVQDVVERIRLTTEQAQKKIKTLTPQQAGSYMQEFKNQMQKNLAELNQKEENYLMKYSEYHHDENWNPTAPPDSITKKEAKFQSASLQVVDLGEGEYKIDFTNDFYKQIFYSYLSQEYKDYMKLKEAEGDEPVIQDAFIVIGQDALGDLLVEYENFLMKYPNSDMAKEVQEDYNFYQEVYLKGVDNSPVTSREGTLLKSAKKEFNRFIKKYPDSPTTPLINSILENE